MLHALMSRATLYISQIVYEEYSTSTRIKAIYILKQKRSIGDIKKAIRVSKTRVYKLISLTR